MSREQKQNTGVLFVVDDKKSDRHPDYNGQIDVDGVAYWVSGWKKKSLKDGKPYLSLAVNPKNPRGQASSPQPSGDFEEDRDIPF